MLVFGKGAYNQVVAPASPDLCTPLCGLWFCLSAPLCIPSARYCTKLFIRSWKYYKLRQAPTPR